MQKLFDVTNFNVVVVFVVVVAYCVLRGVRDFFSSLSLWEEDNPMNDDVVHGLLCENRLACPHPCERRLIEDGVCSPFDKSMPVVNILLLIQHIHQNVSINAVSKKLTQIFCINRIRAKFVGRMFHEITSDSKMLAFFSIRTNSSFSTIAICKTVVLKVVQYFCPYTHNLVLCAVM
jgi:hypothetical protein